MLSQPTDVHVHTHTHTHLPSHKDVVCSGITQPHEASHRRPLHLAEVVMGSSEPQLHQVLVHLWGTVSVQLDAGDRGRVKGVQVRFANLRTPGKKEPGTEVKMVIIVRGLQQNRWCGQMRQSHTKAISPRC